MRLDHLLSKEHAGSPVLVGCPVEGCPGVGGSRATARTSGPGWLLTGGTSPSWPVLARRERQYSLWFAFGWAVPFGAGWNALGVWGRLGTLLGPEGTGAGCVSFLLRAASSVEPSAAWRLSAGLCALAVSWVWWVGAGCGGGSRP